jgi:hypothetical protein
MLEKEFPFGVLKCELPAGILPQELLLEFCRKHSQLRPYSAKSELTSWSSRFGIFEFEFLTVILQWAFPFGILAFELSIGIHPWDCYWDPPIGVPDWDPAIRNPHLNLALRNPNLGSSAGNFHVGPSMGLAIGMVQGESNVGAALL